MRVIEHEELGTLYELGPVSFLRRPQNKTWGFEVVLPGHRTLYFGRLAGKWVLEFERWR